MERPFHSGRPDDDLRRRLRAAEHDLEQALVALEDARDETARAAADRDRLERELCARERAVAEMRDHIARRDDAARAQVKAWEERAAHRDLAKVEELQATLGALHAMTEELEVANEGLRVANEELEDRVAARTAELEAVNTTLRRSEERFHLAQLYAGAGTWDWDIKADRVHWTKEYYGLYGLDPDKVMASREAWLAAILEEDRDQAAGTLRSCLDRRDPDFAVEYRINHPQKGVRWLAGRGRLFLDADGDPARLVGLNIDVTDRRRVEDEARDANQAKSRFLAAASHDLRQPVTAATLFLDLLLRKVKDPEVKDMAEMVAMSLEGLRGMLNSLLDVARLEAGVVKPEPVPFALDDLLQRLASEFEGVARAGKLWLQVPPTPAVVHSDRLLLELVLRNLISNALKYTRHGGVTVDCREEGRVLRVDVVDTGVGIPPDSQDRIFEDFYQADTPARGQGYGIGLATVQRAAKLLGCPLQVRSEVGRGSTFTVWLPLAEDAAPKAAKPARSAARGVALDGPVLLVDDESMILEAMQLLLADWGLEVEAAGGVAEAAERVRNRGRPFALVLTDYQLDDGNGFDVVRCARRLGETPAILLTGDTNRDVLHEANRPGIHLLHKPVDPAALKAAICKLGPG